MQEFRQEEGKFQIDYVDLLISQILILEGIVILLLCFTFFSQKSRWVLFFMLCIYTVALVLYVSYCIWRQRKTYRSYRLQIHANRVICKRRGEDDVVIDFAKITEINESPSGLLIVGENDVLNAIYVPAHIEQYNKIADQLAKIQAITINDENWDC